MGIELPVSITFPVCQLSRSDGKSIGNRLPYPGNHIIHKAGFTKSTAHTDAVTLIQRFGSALNLNVHFHMLYLDGVYAENDCEKVRFHRIKAPTKDELVELVHRVSQRVEKFLERQGFLERDELERLCRYIARPAVSEKRLSLLEDLHCCIAIWGET